jgi:hypothetical protein
MRNLGLLGKGCQDRTQRPDGRRMGSFQLGGQYEEGV